MTAGNDVQAAVYTALSALGYDLYDAVPDAAAFPYVVIGDIAEAADESHTRGGRELTATIHIWSRYAGMKEVRDIAGSVIGALHHKPLALTNWRHVQTVLEFFDVLREPDGVTRHGVLRFRIWVQEV